MRDTVHNLTAEASWTMHGMQLQVGCAHKELPNHAAHNLMLADLAASDVP